MKSTARGNRATRRDGHTLFMAKNGSKRKWGWQQLSVVHGKMLEKREKNEFILFSSFNDTSYNRVVIINIYMYCRITLKRQVAQDGIVNWKDSYNYTYYRYFIPNSD